MPLGTAVPPFDPEKLLDLQRWLNPQPGPASSWYVILGAFFLIAIVAGIYLVWFAPRQYFRHDRYRGMILRNVGQGVLWVASIGLIVVTFRLLDVGFFGMRLWLLVDLLIAIGLAAYLIWYMRTVYPRRIAVMERQRRKAEWTPKRKR
jgi:hypothetical protein